MISVCSGHRDEGGKLHPCGRWTEGSGRWYEAADLFTLGKNFREVAGPIVDGLCPEHEEKGETQ